MILPRPPPCLQGFFRPLRRRLGALGRFRLLAAVLVAWLCCPRRPKLLHLARHGRRRHRTALGRFLGRDDLDAADLLETQALRLLARLPAGGAQADDKAKSEPPLPPLSRRLQALRAALARERIETAVARTRHAPTRRRLRKVLKEFASAA
jgi:hypothetical protein